MSWVGRQRIRVEEVEEDIGEVKTVSTGVWPILRVLSSFILLWIGFGTLSTRVGVARDEAGGNDVINGVEDEEIDGRSWGSNPGKLGSVLFQRKLFTVETIHRLGTIFPQIQTHSKSEFACVEVQPGRIETWNWTKSETS